MTYAQNPSVLTTPLPGGEVALLDTVSQTYFTLNETGGVVWNAFTTPSHLEAAVSELVGQFEVDRETALRAVESVIADLVRDGILREMRSDDDTP